MGRAGIVHGPGGLAPGAQLHRLAPAARDLRPDRHADPRRGRHLRPGALQRPAAARPEGHDERGRAARAARADARRLPEQGAPRASSRSGCRSVSSTTPRAGCCSTPTARCRTPSGALFATFRRTGSAAATVRTLVRSKACASRAGRRTGRAWGSSLWNELTYSRALEVLHNPRYAGAFVLRPHPPAQAGQRSPHDTQARSRRVVACCFATQHAGYISWDEFEEHQRRLRENAQDARHPGARARRARDRRCCRASCSAACAASRWPSATINAQDAACPGTTAARGAAAPGG